VGSWLHEACESVFKVSTLKIVKSNVAISTRFATTPGSWAWTFSGMDGRPAGFPDGEDRVRRHDVAGYGDRRLVGGLGI
jgi:hypothetical protein